MKQGTYINRLVMLLLFLALAAYIGVYTFRSLNDPFSSVLCYNHTVDDTVEATGFVVRQEAPLPVQNGIVDVLPDEGEKVAAGETIAMVYRDAAALERKSEIRQLELELEQLEYSLRQDSGGGDAARLDQEIVDSMVELRRSTAEGNYSRLEEDSMELKNMVFRRNYTYNNNTESVQSITAMIQSVSAQLSSLKSSVSQDAYQVSAPAPGIYSGQVDGFESLLTPENVKDLTVSQLDKLKTRPAEETESIGKLITDSRWYFIAPLTEEQAGRLMEGKQVLVRFSRDFTGEVSMLVEQIGSPENGRVAVVFSSTRFLSEITLLRRQTVEIVFDSVTGLRVPKAALRVEEATLTDQETGEEKTYQQPGVYAVVGMQAEWKPLTILAEEEDFFLVAPAPFQNEQNMNETKKALRTGDEIIVTAENLYDGKVVK